MENDDSKVQASAAKRMPPNAGKGRVKGVPNKSTANVKAALEAAFDKIGGVDRLAQWAEENETEFFKLYAKLLPVHLQGEVKISGTLAERLQRAAERA